ncbi:hypothetical protein LLG90_09995 [Aromatoleum toluclasticum]|uniref:hypothetical protein n=1 Tax=Aromatoleum toluclasticum TaxID=92003 RepID=UPI001D193D64|nr:hypothetical protein [Aromatoleum toluclasticum]MCC4115679.1 hypothetical protein [Aromatoleum toluclasticum]
MSPMSHIASGRVVDESRNPATVSWQAAHAAVAAVVRHTESLGVRVNVGVAGELIGGIGKPGASEEQELQGRRGVRRQFTLRVGGRA